MWVVLYGRHAREFRLQVPRRARKKPRRTGQSGRKFSSVRRPVRQNLGEGGPPPTHVQTEPLHRSFLTGANRENRAPHVASTPFPPVGAFKQLERKYLSIFRFHRRLERVRRCFVSLFGHLPTKLLSGLAGSSPPNRNRRGVKPHRLGPLRHRATQLIGSSTKVRIGQNPRGFGCCATHYFLHFPTITFRTSFP